MATYRVRDQSERVSITEENPCCSRTRSGKGRGPLAEVAWFTEFAGDSHHVLVGDGGRRPTSTDNDIVVFRALHTGTGCVTSWYVDLLT